MTAPERHAQTILARLAQGPARFGELEEATGVSGSYIRKILWKLMDEGKASRVEINNRVWIYYFGDTAPAKAKGGKPAPIPKPKMQYSIPVRHIEVPRYAEYSRNTQATPQHMRITLPAEPWL